MSTGSSAADIRVRKPPRSKNGCLTCLRRKVRCNEQKPRCGHCERLDLICTWRAHHAQASSRAGSTHPTRPESSVNEHSFVASQTDTGLTESLDFNTDIWHNASTLDSDFNWPFVDSVFDSVATADAGQEDSSGQPTSNMPTASEALFDNFFNSPGRTRSDHATSPASSADFGRSALVEQFLGSEVPPILSTIEIGPRWTTTKMLLTTLANSSTMVRSAMMAFSALSVQPADQATQTEHRALYDRAARDYTAFCEQAQRSAEDERPDVKHALATAFFLAYSDLLTNRIREAQAILKDAAVILGFCKSKRWSAVERRLISWLRLVDGRASSAGADGAFLAETDKAAYTPTADTETGFKSERTPGETSAPSENTIEEVLFDVLYSPGLLFYQRVQSIMARVSAIDPWHRRRGTVTDETEVMALASAISSDLHELERQRPALMDHAVEGALTERLVAKDISQSITRSYRVYWANYQASHIHLHRVAYKHLPATAEVTEARRIIKRMAQLLRQSGEQLPVNFIWPLLMASCEEDNLHDRSWMLEAIRGMHGQASNARPVAAVLEEVHKRQDATKQRVDVRQTSMDLYKLSFAVV